MQPTTTSRGWTLWHSRMVLFAVGTLIGFGLLRGLTLASEIDARIDPGLLGSRWYAEAARRAQTVARLARQICGNRLLADESFTAGLLLNVGSLVLAQCFGQSYVEFLSSAPGKARTIVEVERERYGDRRVQHQRYPQARQFANLHSFGLSF